jgi:hypothetical protein
MERMDGEDGGRRVDGEEWMEKSGWRRVNEEEENRKQKR